jgi:hypothetical protein
MNSSRIAAIMHRAHQQMPTNQLLGSWQLGDQMKKYQ